jgi:hypothetical protein
MQRRIGIGSTHLAVLAAIAVSIPPTSSYAVVLWRGDFETGDISQWTRAQQVSPARLRVVDSPVRQGRYALRAEVVQGDNPINASGNRNELVRMTNESEGDERYYGWSTLFPEDYPFTATWQLFTQWHHSGSNGAPPVRFILGCSAGDCGVPLPDTMFFIVNGQNLWLEGPVTRGEWHNFALHVKWSSNPNVGFVELWYDGRLVVPKRHVATLFPGQTNYLKQGLYRDASTRPTQVVYHDGFTIGTTLDDVRQFIAPAIPVSSGGPTDPVDPEDPTDPVDPEDPTDPVDPEDPTDPVDPEDPTNPVDPSDSTDELGPGEVPGAAAGGCSTAGAAPGGLVLLLALSSLGLRRRSRGRASPRGD